jgi:aryl-alcohol dehydrogenase-like predicted oxidoreductase
MWLSPLAIGGSVFGAGGWDGENRKNLVAAYERALAHGIRHLDTASDYGGGASERLIG